LIPERGRVDIFRVPLDVAPEHQYRLAGSLSTDEYERSCSYENELLRDRFISGRGWLRQVLAPYVRTGPKELRFATNRYGKPQLVWPRTPRPNFSLSHSGGLAVVAVASLAHVGVDLELVRPDIACLEVAQQFFSGAERLEFEMLGEDERLTGFFRLWTRKEARAKALGVGLGGPSADGAAGSSAGADVCRTSGGRGAYQDESVTVQSFDVGGGYCAAVAAVGKGPGLRLRALSAQIAPAA
jgi:4'-phosphopantetheinyl transferase